MMSNTYHVKHEYKLKQCSNSRLYQEIGIAYLKEGTSVTSVITCL
uniref:Uncharacterized protein n=1 Tax=Arundo donax TaxID=35708 RepID=A0A0A9H5V6_ARUDO